jgi:SOS-response transcriptional repressor LexA
MAENTNGLTPAQRRIMQAIWTLIARNGYSPSLRELCEETGIRSTNTIRFHVEHLVERGYITREPGQFRTIRPTKEVVV